MHQNQTEQSYLEVEFVLPRVAPLTGRTSPIESVVAEASVDMPKHPFQS